MERLVGPRAAKTKTVTALKLMLLEDFDPFARMVKEAFPEIRWQRARDAEEAGDLLETEPLDGFVVDVHLPGEPKGMKFVEDLPHTHVLMLTSDQAAHLVGEAQSLGVAIDYKPNWKAAIEAFSERVRGSLRFRLRVFGDRHELTHRQREVLRLFVEDYDRQEIAERLGISDWTVREHLRAVLGKSRHTRLAEVRRYIRRGV